jgi:hypothetical protein
MALPDEAAGNAQVIDQFLQYEPNYGAGERFRTEARVTFDDRYLYGWRACTTAPDSIASLPVATRRAAASEQLLIVDSVQRQEDRLRVHRTLLV